MKRNPVIAVVGATGLVGNELLVCLEESDIEFDDLKLFASENSEGEIYSFRDTEYKIETLDQNSFDGVNLALFAVKADLAKKYAPLAIQTGTLVIDSSSAFGLQDDVPLVVPELNFSAVKQVHKIISSPAPSTVQLIPILSAIHRVAGLKRVVVSTYEAVSGAGKAALDELWSQTLAIFNQREIVSEAFQHQIAFNCIPQIDVMRSDGYTKEEFRIVAETRKILGLSGLSMTATAVRVPVLHSHGASVNIELEKELLPDQCVALLQKVSGLEVFPDTLDYPMPLGAANTDDIHVGRIRRDSSLAYGLDMWIVADNVRKGTALNLIGISKKIIETFGE